MNPSTVFKQPPCSLRDWQVPLADKLQRVFDAGNMAAINALPTGAGKTYIVMDLLRRMKDKVLFTICPKSVVTAWHRVAEDFQLQDRIYDVINWEKLQRGKTKHYVGESWKLPSNSLIVIDEMHKGASGPDSKATKMAGQLKALRLPVIVQSATLADSPLKMRAAGYLLGLHQFNTSSFYNWCRKNGCYNSPFHAGLEFPKGERGKKHMVALHEILKDRMLRCRVEDIPGFPDNEIEACLYDLDERYKDEVNKIYDELANVLKQPNSNPMVERLRARQRVEAYKVPLLTDLVMDELEEERSVVVFTSFRETLFSLRDALQRKEVKCSCVYGAQDSDERQDAIDKFQSNTNHVMLAMSQAGGVGISLHDVHQTRPRTSLICPDDSGPNMVQCLGRIHRVGGTKAIQRFVLAAGTVEEQIKKNIDRKLTNMTALNDGDFAVT